jgi:glycosyltransferase involved in cell wall biosynthesis
VFQLYKGLRVAVIVPAHNEERHVGDVIRNAPEWVDHIIVVDDGSQDGTAAAATAVGDPRSEVISRAENGGVGAAILDGHRRALELGADVDLVMAGDDQMDPAYAAGLIDPIAEQGYGFTKANRFFSMDSFSGMPRLRIFGNVVLSFMTKLASGYWHLFDPQNGYTAIHRDALKKIPLDRIRSGYEFENDLLIHLNIARVRAKDVPVPARYGAEVSGIKLFREIYRLTGLLTAGFWRRIWWKYVIQSFSPVALLLFGGLALIGFGTVVGVFVILNTLGPATASAGTVLLSAAPLLSGFHLLISALVLDIQEGDR